MILEAHAKINTVLNVTGRRPDGYHEVDMVLQELSLHDDVELTAEYAAADPARADGSSIAQSAATVPPPGTNGGVAAFPPITITVSDESGRPIPGVPADEKNIAVKAAVRFFEELFRPARSDTALSERIETGKIRLPEALHIHLTKRIPAAAGLAGGSTDAAAVLRGLNVLLSGNSGEDVRKNSSDADGIFDRDELCAIGLTIGADVPYCILGGTMRAQGIGEKLTRLPAMPKVPVLLIKPAEGVSTKEIYEALDPVLEQPGTGSSIHPDVEKCISVFPHANTAAGLAELGSCCGNILESVTAEKLPVIKEIEKQMLAKGALFAMMSGSGPTVFGLFADAAARDRAAEKLAEIFGSSFEIRRTETV